ncbi:MAG TPA: VOC family protein [Candidatus Binatia bacterium]|nr:VOC family protein [Candidatus Binatia bacterium]
MELDSVRIGAADVDDAVAAYALLLGVEPVRAPGDVRRFQLERGAVEIGPGEPGLRAVRFLGAASAAADGFHGLPVVVSPPGDAEPGPAGVAIDHVVVRTPDADRAIRLWRDRLGLRLALDRAFPERGLRLVFFRSAGITLEFATAHPAAEPTDGPDLLYGVSYRVRDLAARRERLLAAGVDVSPIRTGMRPGTSVASVRSGTAGVPTLLLEVDGPP